MKQGLILRSTGSWYEVREENGQIVQARLKGKLKLKGFKVTNPVAVGDRVLYEIENETENTAIISDILPRSNYIIRQSVHKSEHGHILASNIDQAILIATLTFPRTSLGFIDRFLVTAEAFRIPTTIVFNKVDILNDEGLAYQEELKELYESIGYGVLLTSATENEGIQELEALLSGKVSLLAGHSGVGKSTLVNQIAPTLDLPTSEVSTFANKGVHTTTFATMFEIAPETFLIDSPGIKELGLANMKKEEIAHYFPEMRAMLGECRFHNCLHLNEPACAIKNALETGDVAESRFQSYLSMVEGGDNRK